MNVWDYSSLILKDSVSVNPMSDNIISSGGLTIYVKSYQISSKTDVLGKCQDLADQLMMTL